MKRTLASFLIFLIILLTVTTVNSQPDETYEGRFQTDQGNEVDVSLAVADTEPERRKGLMWTLTMANDRGMIFTFPDEEMRGFWMKNTFMPLDMIFLDSEMRVVNIEQADPEPFTKDKELKTYTSERPAKYVLEFKKGFSKRKNISEGDLFLPGEKLSACCILNK